MTKVTGFVDSSDIHQGIGPYDESVKCPDHPSVDAESYYGMGGGGCGVYTFCPECGKILTKSNDPEME